MKTRSTLRLAKIYGFADGRIIRYRRNRWSDRISEKLKHLIPAIGHWDTYTRTVYLHAVQSTAMGRCRVPSRGLL